MGVAQQDRLDELAFTSWLLQGWFVVFADLDARLGCVRERSATNVLKLLSLLHDLLSSDTPHGVDALHHSLNVKFNS